MKTGIFDKELLMSNSKNIATDIQDARNVEMIAEDIYDMAMDAGSKSVGDLDKAVQRGKNNFPQKDFYVELLMHQEPVFAINNKITLKWLTKISCPTPTYDQTVFKYSWVDENLKEIWNVPGKDKCEFYKIHNSNEDIPPNWRQQRDYALDFMSLKLDDKCRQLNNEEKGQPRPVIIFEQ